MAEIKATGEPRFAVFDFEYDSGEGLRKRIAFINWYVSSSRYTALRPILSIAGHPMRIHASLCAPIDTLPCVSRIKDDMPVRLKMLYASLKTTSERNSMVCRQSFSAPMKTKLSTRLVCYFYHDSQAGLSDIIRSSARKKPEEIRPIFVRLRHNLYHKPIPLQSPSASPSSALFSDKHYLYHCTC